MSPFYLSRALLNFGGVAAAGLTVSCDRPIADTMPPHRIKSHPASADSFDRRDLTLAPVPDTVCFKALGPSADEDVSVGAGYRTEAVLRIDRAY